MSHYLARVVVSCDPCVFRPGIFWRLTHPAHLFRERSQHALRMVEWMVEPHHTDRYIREHPDDVEYSHKSIEQELKEAGNSIKKRKEVLQQNYYCITTGSLAYV